MKKYVSAVLFTALSTAALSNAMASSAFSKGKWDVGVAGGWGMTQTKETLIQTTANSRDGYKYTVQGSGPMAGLTAGHTWHHHQNLFGIVIGAYKDFYKGRNSGPKKDFISGLTSDFTKDLKRKYTLEVSGKFGRMLNADLNVYGKLGGVYSQFREQYKDSAGNLKKNLRGWGGVAGVGLQKDYGAFKAGLEYDYQYYARIGSKMYYSPFTVPTANKSKFRPQYHNVFVTISKSF